MPTAPRTERVVRTRAVGEGFVAQLGKYTLIRKLATGGMAEVHLAKVAGPGGFEKTVVVKRILEHLAKDQLFVDMFLAEAKLAAQLSHPNIVQIFDFGEADGAYYLAMEHVDGPNLRSLVRASNESATPLSFTVCARIASSVCDALAYAHDFVDSETAVPINIIHRDVSADNILVSRSGATKVVDFGIAKALGAERGRGQTKTGALKGKVAYMPPEQLRSPDIDRRVDVYALGVVLYELIAGRRPYEHETEVNLIAAILQDPPVPLSTRRPETPRRLVEIVDRAMAKNRDERYPDCRAFASDLDAFIHGSGESIGSFQLGQLVSLYRNAGWLPANALGSRPSGSHPSGNRPGSGSSRPSSRPRGTPGPGEARPPGGASTPGASSPGTTSRPGHESMGASRPTQPLPPSGPGGLAIPPGLEPAAEPAEPTVKSGPQLRPTGPSEQMRDPSASTRRAPIPRAPPLADEPKDCTEILAVRGSRGQSPSTTAERPSQTDSTNRAGQPASPPSTPRGASGSRPGQAASPPSTPRGASGSKPGQAASPPSTPRSASGSKPGQAASPPSTPRGAPGSKPGQATPPPSVPNDLAGGRPRRLLIVDDSRFTAKAIERALAPKGFEILRAESVDEATELLFEEKNRLELVLLDVRMPGVDGTYFCRIIKGNAHLSNVKVFLCSALDPVQLKAIAAQCGADGYIPKNALLQDGVLEEIERMELGAKR